VEKVARVLVRAVQNVTARFFATTSKVSYSGYSPFIAADTSSAQELPSPPSVDLPAVAVSSVSLVLFTKRLAAY
jgi:hypothetical protein